MKEEEKMVEEMLSGLEQEMNKESICFCPAPATMSMEDGPATTVARPDDVPD